MARLHLTYREEAFPERILDLTRRFMDTKPWRSKTTIAPFNIWAHGANLAFDLPECDVVFKKHPAGIGTYTGATDDSVAVIELHKPSVISLFHNYRHHMQANAEYHYDNDEHAGTDAQAWGCSLYYVVAPSQFRRAVRRDMIAGVKPQDLLKRRRK